MTVLARQTKQPHERLPYTYTPVDDMTVGDSLIPLSTTITITPNELGGLTNDLKVTNSNAVLSPELQTPSNIPLVTIWLSAGNSGVTYKVTVNVTTVSGAILEDEFYVKVKEL